MDLLDVSLESDGVIDNEMMDSLIATPVSSVQGESMATPSQGGISEICKSSLMMSPVLNRERQRTQSLSASLDQHGTQRRSSSRSIKRRRFDDEIVESSLGGAALVGSGGKGSRMSGASSSGGLSSPYSVGSSATPLPGGSLLSPSSSSLPKSPSSLLASVPSPSLPPLPTPSSSSLSHTAATTHTVPAQVQAASAEKRKSNKSSSRRRGKPKHSMATKDLGRWKPADDLALIVGVQQTNDLRLVHRGVKFSCRFTVPELQGRWWALLYDPAVSRVAVAAMRNLHPELVAAVRSKALYSRAEEGILARVPSNSQPNVSTFQALLEQNSTIFYPTRTAKSLYIHWQLMKQYHLLPDQTVQGLQRGEQATSLSDAEELLRDGELTDPKDEILHHEMALADRALQREVNRLEAESRQWAVAVDHVTGISPVDFDNQTLAVLRGRLVRYLMRSREISIGRSTKDLPVDVDLSLEGPAWKVSRRQGTIRLRNNGDFFLASEGKRPIIVDGRPLLTGNKTRLNNNSVIEIASLRFIFLVNLDLIAVIRQEAAKMNMQ